MVPRGGGIEAEEKGEDRRFHDQNLLHGGSGGFDGDGASDGYEGGSDIESQNDGFIGRFSIRYEIVTAVHADVVTGTTQIVEARIGWAGVDSWRTGFESTISVQLWISSLDAIISNYATPNKIIRLVVVTSPEKVVFSDSTASRCPNEAMSRI